jgi:hypothetical protein
VRENLDKVEISLIDFLEEVAKEVGAKDWEFCENEDYDSYPQYGITYSRVWVRFYFDDESIPVVVATIREEKDYEKRKWEIVDVKVETKETIVQKIRALLSR